MNPTTANTMSPQLRAFARRVDRILWSVLATFILGVCLLGAIAHKEGEIVITLVATATQIAAAACVAQCASLSDRIQRTADEAEGGAL